MSSIASKVDSMRGLGRKVHISSHVCAIDAKLLNMLWLIDDIQYVSLLFVADEPVVS